MPPDLAHTHRVKECLHCEGEACAQQPLPRGVAVGPRPLQRRAPPVLPLLGRVDDDAQRRRLRRTQQGNYRRQAVTARSRAAGTRRLHAAGHCWWCLRAPLVCARGPDCGPARSPARPADTPLDSCESSRSRLVKSSQKTLSTFGGVRSRAAVDQVRQRDCAHHNDTSGFDLSSSMSSTRLQREAYSRTSSGVWSICAHNNVVHH